MWMKYRESQSSYHIVQTFKVYNIMQFLVEKIWNNLNKKNKKTKSNKSHSGEYRQSKCLISEIPSCRVNPRLWWFHLKLYQIF